MTQHLTEDELILHSYGEIDRADRARVDAHLAECAECQVAKEQLVRILAMVDTAPPVEAPLGFERTAWARLEPALESNSNRSGWRTFFWLPQWALAGGVAALLVAAFVAGRVSTGVAPATTTPSAAVADFEPETVLRAALGDHLDQTQMVLVELANAESGADVLAGEQARAGDLVAANRVIRQSALQSGDGQFVDILEDLERVLLEIANAPADATSNDLTDLQSRIAREDLLFRLRVIASEMRQRTINDREAGDPNLRRTPRS